MSLIFRGETPADHQHIDLVETMAFGRIDTADIVPRMRRNYARFDPSLSVVGISDGVVIAHTLFTPATIRLLGSDIEAVAAGPVSVHPDHQNQGVGQLMLNYGHSVAQELGFQLSFLHGHPNYYPRAGYFPCHGFGTIEFDTEKLGPPQGGLRPRPPEEDDVDWLVTQLRKEFSDVDFGWMWNAQLSEWKLFGLNTLIWTSDEGRAIGYSVDRRGDQRCELLLAETTEIAAEILRNLSNNPGHNESGLRSVGLHPSGWLANELSGMEWAKSSVKSSDAAMAFELTPGILDEYRAQVESGSRATGHVNFPLPFLGS